MKHLLYVLLRYCIRIGFFFYFKEIRLHGIKKIDSKEPMLLLPNHQNALLDPLILAVYASRKPFFLTRSDVFVNPLISSLFAFLRMIPIFRLRDGRDTLKRNREVFDHCADLLGTSEAIIMFPEANHNLMRRVRPLSKGFTRILFHAIKAYPDLNPYLVPIGINYEQASGFPDRAAFYIGDPIHAKSFLKGDYSREAAIRLRGLVSENLKQLTTHIPPGLDYDTTVESLNEMGIDFLCPVKVNEFLKTASPSTLRRKEKSKDKIALRIWDRLFRLMNIPVLIPWRLLVKPRIIDPECISTHRFLYGLLAYPTVYILFTVFLLKPLGISLTILLIGIHILTNLLYVKYR